MERPIVEQISASLPGILEEINKDNFGEALVKLVDTVDLVERNSMVKLRLEDPEFQFKRSYVHDIESLIEDLWPSIIYFARSERVPINTIKLLKMLEARLAFSAYFHKNLL